MSDTPVDKSVVILHRMQPLSGRFEEARKVSEDWFEFIRKMPGCTGVESICCVDEQIAWIEMWASRMAFNKFNEEHVAYIDFPVRMLNCSRGIPSRHIYRKMS